MQNSPYDLKFHIGERVYGLAVEYIPRSDGKFSVRYYHRPFEIVSISVHRDVRGIVVATYLGDDYHSYPAEHVFRTLEEAAVARDALNSSNT